jgi:hypothetical protein
MHIFMMHKAMYDFQILTRPHCVNTFSFEISKQKLTCQF